MTLNTALTNVHDRTNLRTTNDTQYCKVAKPYSGFELIKMVKNYSRTRAVHNDTMAAMMVGHLNFALWTPIDYVHIDEHLHTNTADAQFQQRCKCGECI